MRGRKPKPDRSQVRHRNRPVHEWAEVANVAYTDAPPLPRLPSYRPRAQTAPEPPRPLDEEGRRLWDGVFESGQAELIGIDLLLMLCEQMDERQGVRERVLCEGAWRERAALRALDGQVAAGLAALAKNRRPVTWPAATRRWWRAVSRLPHCALWTDGDWQFAMDTASLVAAFHAGNHRLAQELRARERIMGVTADARRDLRIRYVPPVEAVDPEAGHSVLAMDTYRRAVAEATTEDA